MKPSVPNMADVGAAPSSRRPRVGTIAHDMEVRIVAGFPFPIAHATVPRSNHLVPICFLAEFRSSKSNYQSQHFSALTFRLGVHN